MSTFRDLNPYFWTTEDETDSVVTDLIAIKRDLMRLLTTPKGSVPFNREYGTSLTALLFELKLDPADVITFLYQDIVKWEPRISLSPSNISVVQTDYNTFLVNCTFSVPALNDVSSTTSAVIQNS